MAGDTTQLVGWVGIQPVHGFHILAMFLWRAGAMGNQLSYPQHLWRQLLAIVNVSVHGDELFDGGLCVCVCVCVCVCAYVCIDN